MFVLLMKLSPNSSDMTLPITLYLPVLLNVPIPYGEEPLGIIVPLNIILFPILTVGVGVVAVSSAQVSPLSNE